MSEHEWQPVRIIGIPGHWNYDAIYADKSYPYAKESHDVRGLIVRAKVVSVPSRLPTCGGVVLEIHPDDAREVLGYGGSSIPTICEHQILAD
jgi:hypothetical protein